MRSTVADAALIRQNIEDLSERRSPASADTVIHGSVPRTPQELERIFGSASAWPSWSGVAASWIEVAQRNGFRVEEECTGQTVVELLSKVKNVVIIVAHAEETEIIFYSPPPNGSRLTCEDIRSHAEQIRKNRPLVYLFCCETARITNLNNVTQTLLASGVVAVVAPQTKLNADHSSG